MFVNGEIWLKIEQKTNRIAFLHLESSFIPVSMTLLNKNHLMYYYSIPLPLERLYSIFTLKPTSENAVYCSLGMVSAASLMI